MKRITQGLSKAKSGLLAAAALLFSGAAATVSAQCPVVNIDVPMPLGCKMTTAELCAETESTNVSYAWSTEDGAISGPVDGPCITATEPGTYAVIVTDLTSNCATPAFVVLEEDFNPPTCEIVSPPDGSVLDCNTAGYQATVEAFATSGIWEINWRFVPTGSGWYITSGQHQPTVTFTSGPDGSTVTLLAEIVAMNGCKTTCEIDLSADCDVPGEEQCPIIVTTEPTPLSCKMPTTQICVQDVPGATITWSTEDGVIQGSNVGTCITAAEAGTYTVTVTNASENCTSSATIDVVDDGCVPTCEIIMPEDNAVLECDSSGNIAVVVAEAEPCGVWEIVWRFVDPSPGWYIEDGVNDENMQFHVGADGTSVVLQVEVIAMNGCKTVCEVTLFAECDTPGEEQCPIVVTTEPTPLSCKMPTTQICVEDVPGATITWSTEDGVIQGSNTGACITAAAVGTYTVTVANATEGCSSSTNIEVVNDGCVPTCEIIMPEDGAVLECDSSGNIAVVIAGAEPCGVWEIVWRFINPSPGWYIEDGVNDENMQFHVGADGTSVVLQVEVVAMNGCKTFCEVTLFAECDTPSEEQCPVISIGTPDILTCTDPTAEICVTSSVDNVSYDWTTENGVIDGDADEACVTVAKAGTYSVLVTNNDTLCTSTTSVEVISDLDVPICDIIAPAETPAADSTGNELTAITTDAAEFDWDVDNDDFIITDGADTDTITYTAGPAGSSATFTLTVTSDNGCTSVCEIVITIPGDEVSFCTFTQGFWGNKNGREVMTMLLAEDSIVVGLPGRSITVSGSAAAGCLNDFLPAGGTPGPLESDLGDVTFGDDCQLNLGGAASIPNGKGKGVGLALNVDRRKQGKNVLLGQTFALSLNVLLDESLCDLELCDVLITRKATTTEGGEVIPDPNDLTEKSKAIPKAVQDALANLGLPNTVCGLLELANRALGGDTNLGGANYSQINDAVTAINEVFNECRVLVECRDVVNE